MPSDNSISLDQLAFGIATEDFVSAAIQGLKWKDPATVATTANITLSGEQTIDGVTTSSNRVLVKEQTNAAENGIYVSASGAWSRADDFNVDAEISGAACWILEGTTNSDESFVCTTDEPITLDTTVLTFVQFSGLGQITTGTNLSKSGNTINFDPAGGVDILTNDFTVDSNTFFVDASTNFVGIGTLTPLARLNSLSTLEQLRLSFDATNYTPFTVDSVGDLTIAPTGGDLFLTGNLTVSETIETIPTNPTVTGFVTQSTNLNTPLSVYVVGKYAYVVTQSGKSLTIVDVSDPTSPIIVGVYTDAVNIIQGSGVYVSGNYAYVSASNSNSLVIVDVSDPTNPTLAGVLIDNTNLNGASEVYVSGNYAYVSGSGIDGLAIVDITDPTNPTLTGVISDVINMDTTVDLYVSGNYAYVIASGSNSLAVIDISDPTNPTLAGVLIDSVNMNIPFGIHVLGNYAYVVSNASSSIAVIDITDPANPTLTGSLIDNTIFNNTRGVYVSGNYAYVVSQGLKSLVIIDISDPTNPTFVDNLIDSTNLNGPFGIHVSGKYAYIVSNLGKSLTIVDLNGIDIPTANIGNAEIGYLSVIDNAVIANDLHSFNLNVANDALIGRNLVVTDLLFADASLGKIGIKTTQPDVEFHVDGSIFAESFQSPFGGFGRVQNILSNSERLNITWTTPFGATVVGFAVTAPNGETTAATVDWSTSTSIIGLRQDSLGTTIGNTYTVSFWARTDAITNKDITLDIRGGTGATISVDSIFRRYSVTLVAGSGTDQLDVSNAISGSLFELWGFQLVDGSEPRPYLKTVSSASATEIGGGSLAGTFVADNIISASDTTLLIKSGTSETLGISGASMIITTGDGLGSGSSGSLNLSSGNGGVTGNGSSVTISGGLGGTTSGNAGDIRLAVQDATSGNAGKIEFTSTVGDTLPIVSAETFGANAAETELFIGSRDPNGNVTASGGAEYYRDSGVTSATYESREATTGTNWFKRSVNSSTYIEIHSASDFEALATAGVITITENTTLAILTSFSTATTFIVNGGDLMLTGNYSPNSTITYTGVGDFITLSGTSDDVRFRDRVRLTASGGGRLFNYVGLISGISGGGVTFNDVTITGWDLGILTNVTLLIENTFITSYTGPFVLTNVPVAANTIGIAVGGLLFDFLSTDSDDNLFTNFRGLTGAFLSSSPIRIDPFVVQGALVQLSNMSTGSAAIPLFVTGDGTTGTYSAVVDNSITSTVITSVSDNAGIAVFNHAGTDPLLGSSVTISGFITNTNYNDTFTVSAVTAGVSFEVNESGLGVPFGSSEATGSFIMTGVTITSTAHGLTIGQTLTLDADTDTTYDNGYEIYNIQTNSFDVNATFISTQTGIWNTASLDESNSNIVVNLALENKDSAKLAFGSTNANINATTITDGTYVPVNVTGFTQNDVTERFKLIDLTSGLWEYLPDQPFRGFITGTVTAIKTGSTSKYRFAMSTNSVVPTFATATYIPMEVKTTQVTIPINFFASLTKGDTIQIMVAGDGTSDNLTITDSIEEIQ